MTVLDFIVQYAQTAPDAVALNDNKKSITYKELLNYISDYSCYLLENVCIPGDTVVLKLKNKLDWVIAFLGLLISECWVVPVTDKLSQYELDEIIKTTKAVAVIDEKSPNWETVKSTKGKEFIQLNARYCGILHITSGSTGKAKFCIRTIDSLTSEGLGFRATLAISSKDKILGIPPLYHSYALGAACITALVSGACLYVMDRFVPREIFGVIEREGITVMIIVPVMVRLLCDTYTSREVNLSSLRIVLVGAGAITEEIYHSFLNKFRIALQSNYGSTETGGIVTRIEPEPRQSIGKPMHGVRIRIISENGSCVSIGEEGELWVKCRSMLNGYYGIQGKITDDDGYFPMGDIVTMDENGYLYIKGRKKSIINVGGKKVNPYEVEEVLQKIPEMKECIVVGVNKTNGGEAVKAIVVCDELTEDIIRRHCVSMLTDYKVPSMIEFRERLPRNELGKIKREDLMSD